MSDIELPSPAFVIEVNDEPNMPVYTADQMRAAIKLESERTQALTNAAEQFVAWHKDGVPKAAMLDYFADIFSDAIRTANQKEST
jgi:hypothetical protein